MTEKYCLRIKQGSDEYISPWKISSLIDDLAGEYYKKYLLELIVNRIPDLTEKEELIIFNRSFDMYKSYKNLNKYSFVDKEDILDIYYLGNIISITPNFLIYKVSIIFELHRAIFTRLNSIDILIDKSKIAEYIEDNFNFNKKLDLEPLKTYINSLLSSTDISQKKAKQYCDEKIKNFEIEVMNYENDSLKFKQIDDLKNDEEFGEFLSDERNDRIYKKYYQQFKDTFKNLDRPVVGIINYEERTLDIFAKEFIREELQSSNDNKLEMVDLSKNSPTTMYFLVGFIVIPWLSQIVITNLESEKVRKLKDDDQILTEHNNEIIRLDGLINEFRNEMRSKDSFENKIVNINDYKIKRELNDINNDIATKTSNTLKKNDFLNENIKIILNEREEKNCKPDEVENDED